MLPQIRGTTETILVGLKKNRNYDPKALNKFMKMDARILEMESRYLHTFYWDYVIECEIEGSTVSREAPYGRPN